MYSIAAIALLAGGGCAPTVVGGGNVFSSAPIMKNSVPIPTAEMKSESLRPSVSTRKNTKIVVATSFTIPYTPDARSEFDVPVYPICQAYAARQQGTGPRKAFVLTDWKI